MSEPAAAPRERRTASAVASDLMFGTGGRIASTVYGTVTVMATMSAFGLQKHPWRLAVLVASTAVVLWIAHLYAHALSESLSEGRRLGWRLLVPIARREIGIVLAAVPPVIALVLGAVGVLHEDASIWIALGLCLTTLAVQGVRYARLAQIGRGGMVAAVALNVALGVVVVVLKATVLH